MTDTYIRKALGKHPMEVARARDRVQLAHTMRRIEREGW